MTASGGRRRIGAAGLGLVVLFIASSPSHAQTVKLLQKFADWTAYVHEAPNKKICFIMAKPKKTKPKKIRRDPVFFYISHWPDGKVHNEISVKIGYPFRKGSKTEVEIGKTKFKLFTDDEGAWVDGVDREKKLIGAMKKGSLMIVKGRSKRGTRTTDRYSLSGLSDALARIDKECPRTP